MTGPHERVRETQEMPVLTGRIELDVGGRLVLATVRGGDATIELIEQVDDAVFAFGQPEPVRLINERVRLRLVIECDLGEMTVDYNNAGPGDGEAVTGPDSRHRS